MDQRHQLLFYRKGWIRHLNTENCFQQCNLHIYRRLGRSCDILTVKIYSLWKTYLWLLNLIALLMNTTIQYLPIPHTCAVSTAVKRIWFRIHSDFPDWMGELRMSCTSRQTYFSMSLTRLRKLHGIVLNSLEKRRWKWTQHKCHPRYLNAKPFPTTETNHETIWC